MKQIYEMVNLTRKKSGQPFDILVDSVGSERKTKYNEPRLKAKNNGIWVIAGFKNGEYTNFQTPKDNLQKFGKAKELRDYVIKIKTLLELHWDNEITDAEFLLTANFVKKGYDVFNAVNKAIEVLRMVYFQRKCLMIIFTLSIFMVVTITILI